ncbi:hypothetical protein B566_EDAN010886 [Ephemera danica]|nr:hypothetical protein B566_EDAN010886 [Ephemera danica]
MHGYCLEDERGACSLVCDEGYAFALAPDPDVTCNPTSHDSPFPDCSVMTLPNSFSQHVSADLTQDEIQDDCNLLANSIEAEISNAVSQACTGVECHLQRVSDPCAQEEFVTQSPSEDEENNVYAGQLRVPGTGPSGVRVTLGIVKALLTTTNAGGNARNFSQKLPALRIRLDPAELGCPAGSVLRATDICVQCPRGTFLKPGAKECFLCGVGFFQPKSGEQACLPCPKGTSTKPGTLSTKRQHCRPLCKPGTKSRDGVTPCSPCPLGTFQPLSGQRACTPCPANMTTQRRGATDKQFCKIPCAAGSVSRSGLAPCLLCPNGYSQPRTGQKVCEPGASICALSGICPPPLHASHPCLRSPCHVSSICLPLHPRQSRHFRCHCSPGRTGTFCEEIRDVCASLPCDNGGTCIPGNNDALSSCDCLPACESDSCEESNVTTSCTGESCERNSNLLSEEKDTTSCSSCLKANFTCNCTAGFSGLLCEEDIDECAEMPCGEFGLCTDLPDEGFICDCTQCEMIESACSALEPCVTGVCLDEPGASFHCECPATRGGVRCEEIRDPCEAKGCLNGATCVPEPWPEEEIGQLPNASSSPCLNGGTCRAGVSSELPGGYTCTCTGGFAGETCNISLPKDAVLRFPGGGSLGYVLRENALSRPLQELTLCSWLRTADTLNYGTPVSYATPQQDNTLALTDYSGFVVYVNGERAVTDVAVNDGAWHLVCLLWASRPRGAWRLYKDGILSDQGEGLANNTQIPGGGTLVLGQEQDSPGGSFSSAQSFLGRLGPTALWPTLLSPSRLRAMFERCGDDETIADLAGVNASEEEAITAGDALESSEFCAGCTPPLTPPHGLVNVSGVGAAAVATFSCQPGFRPVGARRAECGKRGTWQTDSPQPPTCQRLSCGKPTAHINSKLQGSGFEFESKLRIVCLTGFVLPSNAIEFIECLSSGKWSPLPPPCVEARCSLKNLSKIANGTWQHLRGSGEELGESTKATDARFAEQVELVCETGLAPRGASLFTCLDGGHWDTNDESLCVHPACVKSPPRLQHARIPLVSGVKARYSCFPNYTMQGSPLVTCVEGWRPLPTCVPVSTIVRCPAAPRVENSNLSLDSGTARYVCADGFTLEGEAEIRCSKTGTWPPAPVCQAVAKCLTAPELEHGTVTVVNDVANLVCNTDYFLVGAAELRCEGSSWIGEAKCHLLGCLPPKPVEHGTVNVARGRGAGPQVLKGAIAEYKCASGYQLVGPRARKCLSHKQQWSSVEPYCKPVAT